MFILPRLFNYYYFYSIAIGYIIRWGA